MIVPNDLTIEELIGALKVEELRYENEGKMDDPGYFTTIGNLNILETVKRALDKKADKVQPTAIPDGYCKKCLNGEHEKELKNG